MIGEKNFTLIFDAVYEWLKLILSLLARFGKFIAS